MKQRNRSQNGHGGRVANFFGRTYDARHDEGLEGVGRVAGRDVRRTLARLLPGSAVPSEIFVEVALLLTPRTLPFQVATGAERVGWAVVDNTVRVVQEPRLPDTRQRKEKGWRGRAISKRCRSDEGGSEPPSNPHCFKKRSST